MKATFAAGCFWSVQQAFDKVPGVLSTSVGYTGGITENPSYEEVYSGKTDHAEAVQVYFDPSKVTYKKLLEVFWRIHDPTQKNRQGWDIGTQYRSAIFYHDEKQKKEALESRAEQEESGKYKKKIVTEITEATEFYRAEEYHQKYLEKRGRSVC